MDLPIVMCVDIAVTSSIHIDAVTKLSFHAWAFACLADDTDAAQRKYAGTLLNFILFVAAKSFYVCAVSEHGYRTVKPSSSLLKSWDQSPSSFGAVQFAYSAA